MESEEKRKKETGLGGQSTVPRTRTKHGGPQAGWQQVSTRMKHRKQCYVSERKLPVILGQAVRPEVLSFVGTTLAFSERYTLFKGYHLRHGDVLQLAVCL